MVTPQYKTIQESELRSFTEKVFLAMKCSETDAQQAADVLISSDLRGIDSHGVARLSGYIRLWEAGRINTQPQIKIVKENKTTFTLDADGALGLVSGPFAMREIILRTQEYGSAWAAIGNSNHFGIAGYHALMATRQNLIGMSMTNASPLVAPTFGKERLLGTNPICFSLPAGQYPPVVVDMATSTAANGKLEIAQRQGEKVPEGWVQDEMGKNTNDPFALKNAGSLLPLGSEKERGSHKGFGLSAIVDLMSGVLSGANFGPWVPPFVSFLPLAENMPGKGLGHFMGAWDVAGFADVETFKSNMDLWIKRFKESEAIQGKKVIIPGEPEYLAELQRQEKGIPLIDKVWIDLEKTAEKFGINF